MPSSRGAQGKARRSHGHSKINDSKQQLSTELRTKPQNHFRGNHNEPQRHVNCVHGCDAAAKTNTRIISSNRAECG
jgi:hypothetical protein